MDLRYVRKGPNPRIKEPFGVEHVDEHGVKRLYYYSKESVRTVFRNFAKNDYDGVIHFEKKRSLINGFYNKIYQFYESKDKQLLSFIIENISSMLSANKYRKWLESAGVLVVVSDDFFKTIADGVLKALNMKKCIYLVVLDHNELNSVPKRINYLNYRIHNAFKENIDKIMEINRWVVLTDIYSAPVVKIWIDKMRKEHIDVEPVYLFSSN